jgi:selenocysteine-specific translation elongation factor
VVLNKLDISGTDRLAALFPEVVDDRTVMRISASTGKGINLLKTRLIQLLDDTR